MKKKKPSTDRINIRFKKNFFDKIDEGRKAYWLAYLYSEATITEDGYFYLSKTSASDIESLISFLEDVDLISDIKHERRTRDGNRIISTKYYISFKSEEFAKGYYGYFKEGTRKMKGNQRYPNIAPQFNRDFIRGLIDSKSTFVSSKKEGVPFYLLVIPGDEKILKEIQLILWRKLKLKTVLRENDKSYYHNEFSLTIQSKAILPDLILYLYDDVKTYEKEKYRRFIEVFDDMYPE